MAKVKKEIAYLKEENKRLAFYIQNLKTSDKFFEEFLRRKFGYIRKGEKIYVYSRARLRKSLEEGSLLQGIKKEVLVK